MLNKYTLMLTALVASLILPSAAFAGAAEKKCQKNWVEKSDEQFAKDCADMAFSKSLKNREKVAWMFFARINQLIEDKHGISESGRVPVWMAWATDSDTFQANPTFTYSETSRDDITPVTQKKVLAGQVSLNEPDAANEEVTRNAISYNYLTSMNMQAKFRLR